MASPKTRARKTVSKVENKNAEKSKSAEEPVVPESPATGSSDETIVGSIKF
jgi:hypothetical protein